MSKESLACETCKHFIPSEFGHSYPQCERTKAIKVIPAKVYKESKETHFTDCWDERERDFPGCGPQARHWEPNWWARWKAPLGFLAVASLVGFTVASCAAIPLFR